MCGIFGKISAKEEKLELSHFNILGFFNDERGGDSVGVFIDGKLEIGVDDLKKYPDFMKKSELLNNVDTARIAIGHTRKASIGKVNADTAQPVCIYNEQNEIVYMLVHNGTIFNYSDLAKKYIPLMDIKDMTDTQVMANIFYFCGYDVLAEYEGAGAFVIVDYRELKDGAPIVLFFKGASLRYRYAKDIEEERPLYMTMSDDTLWFSSLGKPLSALNYPLEALTIRANTLIRLSFKKDKLTLLCSKEYDRSKQFQYKSTYQSENEYSGYGKAVTYGTGYKTGGKMYEKSNTKASLWIDETFDYIKDKIGIHKDGLYYLNHKKAHGVIKCNFYGHIQHDSVAYVHMEDEYAFFMGRLLPNKEVFTLLSEVAKSIKCGHEEFAVRHAECVDKYSYIPVVNLSKDNEVLFFEQDDFDKTIVFSGQFKTMFAFNNFTYTVEEGSLTKRVANSVPNETRKMFEFFVDAWSPEVVDYEEEFKDMVTYICNKETVKI